MGAGPVTKAIIRVCVSVAAVVFGRAAVAQSTIELRSSAKVAPNAAVVLSQIATLNGSDADALADVSILPGGSARGANVTIREVRRALDSQGMINWGRVTLRGSVCTLVAPVEAVKPVARRTMTHSPLTDKPDSVQRAVSDRVSHLIQAVSADLRLSFDPDDADILNLSTTGRTLEIKPTAASDKLPLAITLYEGDRIVESKSIRVGVLVRRKVAIAAAAKSRGATIEQADVTIDEQWVGPNLKPAGPDAVIGAAAQGRISVGQIIGLGDVAPAMIVAKGEQVSVSCVSGSIVLTTKARAMLAGRVGDVIQFQGLEDKRTFAARMSGRGRAVVAAAPTDGKNPEASR
jgi:flagella basal body P-ring formation protein FlgA